MTRTRGVEGKTGASQRHERQLIGDGTVGGWRQQEVEEALEPYDGMMLGGPGRVMCATTCSLHSLQQGKEGPGLPHQEAQLKR